MTSGPLRAVPPILRSKHHGSESVFNPENLLREARRQKNLPDGPVPDVCILDPDGDIVRHLRVTGRAQRVEGWACYHSEMFRFTYGTRDLSARPTPRFLPSRCSFRAAGFFSA